MKVDGGKVAIVTGGAQGLGWGFTEALLKKGSKVCICDVNSKQGEATLNELHRKFGTGNSIFVRCDVTNHDDFEAVFRKVVDRFGGVDIVVNNAGVNDEHPGNWRRTIMINTIGVIEGTLLAMKYMSLENEGRGGVVINISSAAENGPALALCGMLEIDRESSSVEFKGINTGHGSGLTPAYNAPVYTASKHGVVGYTRSAAANPDVKKTGIRYTCLCPHFIQTPLFSDFMEKVGRKHNRIVSYVQHMGVSSIESVANAFMLLVENDDNNGAVMTVSVKRGIEYRHGKPATHKL